jgi:transposase-like protein
MRSIFAQPDAETVLEHHRRIVDQLETRFPEAAACSRRSRPTRSPSPSSPRECWRPVWSNNSLERLNKRDRPALAIAESRIELRRG